MNISKEEIDKVLRESRIKDLDNIKTRTFEESFKTAFIDGVSFAQSKLKPKPLEWSNDYFETYNTNTSCGKVEIRNSSNLGWVIDIQGEDLICNSTKEEAMKRVYELHCEALNSFYS